MTNSISWKMKNDTRLQKFGVTFALQKSFLLTDTPSKDIEQRSKIQSEHRARDGDHVVRHAKIRSGQRHKQYFCVRQNGTLILHYECKINNWNYRSNKLYKSKFPNTRNRDATGKITCNFNRIGDFEELFSVNCVLAWKSGKVITADGMSNPWLASGGYSSMCRKP